MPEPLDWISVKADSCHKHLDRALEAGHIGECKTYVGRTEYAGDVLPCRVTCTEYRGEENDSTVPKTYAVTSYGCKEVDVEDVELYCPNRERISWVPCENGKVPAGAVGVGHTYDGELLYVGRAHYHGNLIPGKIHGTHGCLYIAYDKEEVAIKQYEVMVYQSEESL